LWIPHEASSIAPFKNPLVKQLLPDREDRGEKIEERREREKERVEF